MNFREPAIVSLPNCNLTGAKRVSENNANNEEIGAYADATI